MKNENKFEIKKALEIQAEQLANWKAVLLPDVYKELEIFAKEDNEIAENGFDIKRGDILSDFVKNYSRHMKRALTEPFARHTYQDRIRLAANAMIDDDILRSFAKYMNLIYDNHTLVNDDGSRCISNFGQKLLEKAKQQIENRKNHLLKFYNVKREDLNL